MSGEFSVSRARGFLLVTGPFTRNWSLLDAIVVALKDDWNSILDAVWCL